MGKCNHVFEVCGTIEMWSECGERRYEANEMMQVGGSEGDLFERKMR